MSSAGYDLDAAAEGSPTRAQMWLMLQVLLEDRFQLKYHRETRELPVYEITAAKGGFKLRQPVEGDCLDRDPIPVASDKARCGDLEISAEKLTMSLQGKQVTNGGLG